jgi:hypothetical protein
VTSPAGPIFAHAPLDAAIDDWDALLRRRDLNNGQALTLLVYLLLGNMAMQDTPEELWDELEDAVESRDPRAFAELCKVDVLRDLPPHWRRP